MLVVASAARRYVARTSDPATLRHLRQGHQQRRVRRFLRPDAELQRLPVSARRPLHLPSEPSHQHGDGLHPPTDPFSNWVLVTLSPSWEPCILRHALIAPLGN